MTYDDIDFDNENDDRELQQEPETYRKEMIMAKFDELIQMIKDL